MSLNNVVPGAKEPGEVTARAGVTSAIARLTQAAPEGRARRGAQAPSGRGRNGLRSFSSSTYCAMWPPSAAR